MLEQARAEWRIVRLPAIAEPDDPLGRPVRTSLWPEWEDSTALMRKRDLIGERAWSALSNRHRYRRVAGYSRSIALR